jgi:hypothetical protein
MIPMIVQIHVTHPRGGLRLWIPLFLLWLLLLPFALLLLPLGVISLLAFGINPWRAGAAVGGVAGALSGTLVQVTHPQTSVLIRIL